MIRNRFGLVFLLCLLILLPGYGNGAVALAGSASTPVVLTTNSGPIRGLETDGISAYKGIPYAAPPVGDLRFAPTQDVPPWTETLNCEEYGPIAVQENESGAGLPGISDQVFTMSEDCLTLNVWTPAKAGEKLPVYVFIHGGAGAQGTGASKNYDGTSFAQNGIVMVTINYRLNALGWFASNETYAQYGTTGNWGLLDQIKALEWLQKNIAAFGGDPENVTIGGESFGAYGVSAMMVSPLAKGLFHRAILESGTILGMNNAYAQSDLERSIEVSSQMAFLFDAADDAKGLATLRAADADVFALLSRAQLNMTETYAYFMFPVFDGHVLPKDPVQAVKEGYFNDVPVLMGYNADEGSLFIPEGMNGREYEMVAAKMLGYENSRKALARFPIDANNGATARMRDVIAKTTFTTSMKFMADAYAKAGNDVYFYYYNHKTPLDVERGLGARHAGEMLYVFNNLRPDASDSDRTMAGEMHSRWVNFIKTGDPNDGLSTPPNVAWPKYDPDGSMMLHFDHEITAEPMPEKANMVFYQKLMYGE